MRNALAQAILSLLEITLIRPILSPHQFAATAIAALFVLATSNALAEPLPATAVAPLAPRPALSGAPHLSLSGPAAPAPAAASEMYSPPMFGVGLAMSIVGAATTGTAITFIAVESGGSSGGYFNYRAVGLGMLAPGILLLGGGLALAIGGGWHTEPPKRKPTWGGGSSLVVKFAPGAVFGTF